METGERFVDEIIKPRYAKLFRELQTRNMSISEAAKFIGMNYNHFTTAVNRLEEEGFLYSEYQSKKKIISLTQAGEKLSEGCALVLHALSM